MKPSPKQIIAFNDSDARINILEGAVRSGKSYICLLRFIKELYNGPPGEYCIVGKSERTVLHNVIEPMINITQGAIRYNRGLGEFKFNDRKVYVVGANDERAEGKIRGSTFAGALVDEATIIPRSFFMMLLSRLSIKGAKVFCTTNPDSPYHWLKTDYIDRAEDLDLKTFKFKIEDNPSLDPKFVSDLKNEYKGIWYKRFIDGEWVVAEGAVFDFFDTSHHVVSKPPTYGEYFILGIDYGTTNAFACVLVGYNSLKRPHIWVEKEYYWDSRVIGRQKVDSEYVQDIRREFGGYPLKMLYVDPSAASFQAELRKAGLPVKHANNEVLDGIRNISMHLINGDLVICRSCSNLIKEIEGYVWDEKAVKRGEDKPMKVKDHACVVGNTLIETDKGFFEIKDLCGKQPYVRSGKVDNQYYQAKIVSQTGVDKEIYELELENGKKLKATGDHKIWTKRSYIELLNLFLDDEILCDVEYSKVKSIKKVSNEDVYCMEVPRTGNFYANGILVKNCDAMRYAIYTHFGQKRFLKEVTREEQQQMNRQSRWAQNPMAYPGYTNSDGWEII